MSNPSNWHTENGFEFALFPAQTEKPQSLIILLHGAGDHAGGFDTYADAVHEKIPGADVISLQAPIALTDEDGYVWFPYGEKVMPQVKAWLGHVFNRLSIAGKVESFARAQLEKRGLTEENLAYRGISMGAMVALETGLTGKKPVAAIVSSGGSVAPFTKIRRKANIFLQMGEYDNVFNNDPPRREKSFFKNAFNRIADRLSLRHGRSVARLQNKKVTLTEKIYARQDHMLDGESIDDGIDFMAKALSRPKN